MRRTAAALVAAAGLIVLRAGDAAAQGCSMCRTALGGAEDPLARGLSWSSVFMLSMPFAVFGTVAGWIILSHRRGARGPEADRRPVEARHEGGNEG
jgi:hypothetical protein